MVEPTDLQTTAKYPGQVLEFRKKKRGGALFWLVVGAAVAIAVGLFWFHYGLFFVGVR